ncbi:hypothetical protein [Pseudomonas abieticivorans]|uniref:hypothetical protein n=1 Tax=Pseudomonas abieticivorans TaxID=2931382 RepID=UPI0020BD6544|nr:hypothetical protein [Pseudomonas sp. PIA16]
MLAQRYAIYHAKLNVERCKAGPGVGGSSGEYPNPKATARIRHLEFIDKDFDHE